MNLIAEQKYQILFELFQAIRDTFELDEIMTQLLDMIQPIIDYDAAGIFVLNEELEPVRRTPSKNLIAGMSSRGYYHVPTTDDMLSLGKGIIGHVIATGTSRIIPDVSMDPRYIEARKGTCSEITVPILRNDRAIGAVNLESDLLNAYDESDLEVLQFFADAASIALEKAILHRQLLDKELIDKQLQLAREVQMHLLPMENPSIPGYDIAGICIPAEEIGGDYYDFIELPQGNLGIVTADVSGHGIASAMTMTAFRGLLRTCSKGKLDPAETAVEINQHMPEFTGNKHFITLIYGVLDPKSDKITFTSCGHPPAWLIHSDGRSEFMTKNGPALGVFDKINYENESKQLQPGDILIIYTDGAIETDTAKIESYGILRLKIILNENRDLPAKDLIQRVISHIRAFSGSPLYLDDVTLVIVKKL